MNENLVFDEKTGGRGWAPRLKCVYPGAWGPVGCSV